MKFQKRLGNFQKTEIPATEIIHAYNVDREKAEET